MKNRKLRLVLPIYREELINILHEHRLDPADGNLEMLIEHIEDNAIEAAQEALKDFFEGSSRIDIAQLKGYDAGDKLFEENRAYDNDQLNGRIYELVEQHNIPNDLVEFYKIGTLREYRYRQTCGREDKES